MKPPVDAQSEVILLKALGSAGARELVAMIIILFLLCVAALVAFTGVFLVFAVILLFVLALFRCLYMIYTLDDGVKPLCPGEKAKTMIVLGSGGHTAEMLMITRYLDKSTYSPRIYVVAATDPYTEKKILAVEGSSADYVIRKITRSREVHQSFITSIFTTILSMFSSIPVVLWNRPDLILCNGPGVCVPVCVIAFLTRALFLANTKIVFIESICRVKTLSLTGKILLFVANRILVQWPELCSVTKRARYIGHL